VKREFQRDVEREVGLAHLAAVDLPFDGERFAEIGERKLARFARAFLKKRVIFFEGRRGTRPLCWFDRGHYGVCGRFSKLFSKAL
jgi:hypothetical protein